MKKVLIKHYGLKQQRKGVVIKENGRKEKENSAKGVGPLIKNIQRLMVTNLNLRIEKEGQQKAKEERNFIKAKFSASIVKNGDTLLMTVGMEKASRKEQMIMKAHVVQEDLDSDIVLLMVTNNDDVVQNESWYLDTGCLNHMTNHKEWLTDLDTSRKSKV